MEPKTHRMLLVATVLAASCTRVGTRPEGVSPRPGPEPVVETTMLFDGTVTLDDRHYPLTLEMRGPPSAEATDATLRIPELGIIATGRGRLDGAELRIDLRYDNDCAGVLRLEARLEQGVQRSSGVLEAKDCTGSESGPATLRRR